MIGIVRALGGLTRTDLRFYALLAAILVYAAAGQPTPPSIGVAEIAVGGLLLFAAGAGRIVRVFPLSAAEEDGGFWRGAGRLLLFYGLSVPVLVGIVSGHDVAVVLRDVVPFLFLVLPLFFMPLPGMNRERAGLTAAVVAVGGLIFSLRLTVPILSSGNGLDAMADPLRLGNAPTVLFAALYLLGMAGLVLCRPVRVKGLLLALAGTLAAVSPLVTMALITQRASIGYVMLFLVVLAGIGLVRRPLRAIVPCAVLAALAVAGWPALSAVGEAMMQKNAMVGGNMRWPETMAVLDRLGGAPFSILFGQGWGATFASPAVGGEVVNYTHNLLTTYLLKTGLCGVVLVSAYLGGLAVVLGRLIFLNPIMGLAILGPFLIDIFLYASFKSLDFGLLLLLIPLGAFTAHKLHKNPSYSIQRTFPEPETEKAGPA